MCVFCKIVNRELEAKIVYEDSEVIAFKDINPQAPVHILIVPKQHIERHSDLTEEHLTLIGKMHLVAVDLARSYGLKSYRLVLNCGEEAGQSVWHLHLHLLGGRTFSWPPG